ncbi:hypothetical protein, partial [Xanthomonas campestris]|uniref:hypothetical protein n=1 Tax=Xanthomonas campestris TaxID=339 RepID=UPI002B2391A3
SVMSRVTLAKPISTPCSRTGSITTLDARDAAFSVTLHRAQARSYEAGHRNRIRRDTGKAIARLIPIGM